MVRPLHARFNAGSGSRVAAAACVAALACSLGASSATPAPSRPAGASRQATVTARPPAEEVAQLEGKPVDAERLVRVWTIVYRAYDGAPRRAYVVLPRWYGPKDNPRLPLVISPHGRGIPAKNNVKLWGDLPAIGRFAVINPDGQGRRLALYSWGDPEEIHDLSRMPVFLHQAMPWLRIAKDRVYAFGGSMGGQETLLLVARYPNVIDGAAAFDSPTNMRARYFALPGIVNGSVTQALLQAEIGGTPWQVPQAYAIRSPLDWARQIAFSRIPLQIWWSTADRIVTNQAQESGLLYREIVSLNPAAPVRQFVGRWQHSKEMPYVLPKALQLFGLMPPFQARAPGFSV